jgi:phytoene synthase
LDAEARDAAIRAIVKAGDPDRYTATLFVPRPAQERLFALYAFNIELARIAELVKEPQLGEIRLQWWREAMERGLAGEATGHPVAEAIARAARDCNLTSEDLDKLIDARHFDVSVKHMPDDAALDAYLDRTAGTLFRLAARIADAGGEGAEPASVEKAAKAAGMAYGLTGLMRALPAHLVQGRIDIPADALSRNDVAAGELLAGKGGDGLNALLGEWRGRATAALKTAAREAASLPAQTRAAFLPLALVEPYLSALAKLRDPLRQVASTNPLYRLWRLGTYRFR